MSAQVRREIIEGQHGGKGHEQYLVTAGGKIRCLRCTARSTRSKRQCAKPALKSSATQKCQVHGGRPHSADVLRRIAEANTLHGESTKAAKEQYRRDAVFIRQLEDAMRVLKMGEGPRMRGRKPAGYEGVYNTEGVVRMFREREQQRNLGGER
jgi:hypothetical protein